MPKVSVLADKKDYLIQEYQNGRTFLSLAEEAGVSECGLRKFLKKHINLRDNPRKPKEHHLLNDEITRLYYEDISAYQMATELNIPLTSLARILKKLNLDISHRSKIRVDPIKSHTDEIICLYNEGKSESEITRIYNCEGSSVSRLLSANNIKTRYIYNLDHNFLDKIDVQEKAYFLGYFMADGCNHDGNNFSIGSIDLEILERFKEILNYDGIITSSPAKDMIDPKGTGKIYRSKKIYRLTVGSSNISQRLTTLGCPQRKTFITKFPDKSLLPQNMYRHYIRGLLDGDGSIFHSTYPKIGINVSIAGTKELLEPILDIIRAQTDINGGGIYPQGTIYQMKIGGQLQVMKLLDWLYSDATIYLQRKFSVYNTFKRSCEATSV